MGAPADNSDKAAPELIEFVQFYALRQDPVTLMIESASRQRGWVAVHEGDVVRAWTAGGLRGVEAFIEIISWNQPSIAQLSTGEIDDHNVELPLAQLLLETYWKVQDWESSDPEQEAHLPVGLDEDTAVSEVDVGPPDGVTKTVLNTAQGLSQVTGFVAVALISTENGALVDKLGRRSKLDVPTWLSSVAIAQAGDDEAQKALFLSEDFIDVLLPPVGETYISYFIRVDRKLTNLGLLEVALSGVLKAIEEA